MTSALNIHFCGTHIKATRKGTASISAVSQFENTLILSGVGAAGAFDKHTQQAYPTPGTFYVDKELKPKKRLFYFSDTFFHIAGLIYGVGEANNIDFAMQHIDKLMEGNREQVQINISGYSRGGVSAIHLANVIDAKYGQQIKLNLFLTHLTQQSLINF
jgi:hypothetical protein